MTDFNSIKNNNLPTNYIFSKDHEIESAKEKIAKYVSDIGAKSLEEKEQDAKIRDIRIALENKHPRINKYFMNLRTNKDQMFASVYWMMKKARNISKRMVDTTRELVGEYVLEDTNKQSDKRIPGLIDSLSSYTVISDINNTLNKFKAFIKEKSDSYSNEYLYKEAKKEILEPLVERAERALKEKEDFLLANYPDYRENSPNSFGEFNKESINLCKQLIKNSGNALFKPIEEANIAMTELLLKGLAAKIEENFPEINSIKEPGLLNKMTTLLDSITVDNNKKDSNISKISQLLDSPKYNADISKMQSEIDVIMKLVYQIIEKINETQKRISNLIA